MNIGSMVRIEKQLFNSPNYNPDLRNSAKNRLEKTFLIELAKNYEYIQERHVEDAIEMKMELVCIPHQNLSSIKEDFEELIEKHPESEKLIKGIMHKMYHS